MWSQVALAVAALMLLATSLGLLFFGVGPTLVDWSRMRHWQAVPAQVESARLHQGGTARGGTYYQALVRHRYIADGTHYTGQRAVIDTAGDGGRRYHEQLVAQWQAAQRTGAPIQVWVNPDKPAESVADRSLRVGSLLWDLVTVVLTGAGGLLLLRLSVSMIRRERRLRAP
ncbi:DUF3592 domain-containing protein [Acidovorax sp. LjRoot117]|uniref:DUF3592 domain-containing protein n=1 Tax=Acidovorax sp. LjRoot117 TaxID=3342255 RepID=UPI003ED0BF66